ncbi:MAG: bifunctional hydroxymethylpyrimidine kinase/phosphomethylpyrimidine kinase [Candidatus Eremiobacteraeota bacterium]|nr:bifunctional hydroxymethylpyrimidine kinase/phosphomethylpyrimidine kinase [Candidatus Eremiobacteraeota bacterium]
MTSVLSIGTTHPWNIAGVGLDMLVGHELGVRTVTVRTAVTAQDERGLHAIETLSPYIVRAQFETAHPSETDAVRVGALTSAEMVAVVGEGLRSYHAVPIVVDPVFHASRGGVFADGSTIAALREAILTLPNVIATPNIGEARQLLGGRHIDRNSLAQAARDVQQLGCRAVLLKGGHLPGNPVDALATRDDVELFDGARVDGELRGTGCLLAMALACALAQGDTLSDAVRFARAFVRRKIASPRKFGGLPVAY